VIALRTARTWCLLTGLGAIGSPALAAPADAGSDAGADAAAPQPDAAAADDAAAPVDAAAIVLVAPPVMVPVAGRALEMGTRNPVAAAAIAVDGTIALETGADGRFRLAVPTGAHVLSVRIGGREIAQRALVARPDQPVPEQIFRIPPADGGVRYGTLVRASRPEIQSVAMSADEARQAPGTGGDPFRVIGLMPGVLQIAWPFTLYVVRGANPGNTGFFLDGVRVPELFHLALPRSVIHPYLIDQVDFFPGGGPANYGPYVSGIMTARTAAPPADRVHASADVTVYDAGGIVTAPWDGGRGTVAVAARYSYTGELFSALSIDTVLRYGDYQVRVDHPLWGGQATAFAFGSLDDLGWVNPGQLKMEYGALQFHRLDLRWRRAAGGGRVLVGLTLGVDWANSTLYDRPIKVRALSASPRLIYTHAVGARAEVEVGANADAQSFLSDVPMFQRNESDLARSRSALSQAAYATLILRPGARWVISPGLRLDVFSEEGVTDTFVEPRLDVLFRVSNAFALKANAGRFAQMPSLPVSVPGFEAFGLADLGAQTSLGGSLGGEAQLPAHLTLSVTGFYQKLRVTDVRNIDVNNPDPAAPDFLVSRLGRAYGVEVLLRRADIGRMFGWLAYTLSWSERYDDLGVLGRSDWDERHILNLVSGYRLGRAVTLGLGFHLNTGRWAPVIDSPGGDYRQLSPYYQLDLRAERRFVFDRFVMDLYADFENITLNNEPVQFEAFQTYNGPPTVVQESFRIILPTIGVHGQF